MPYQELLILLPCHSLEDFPTYHEGDDAQSLLASWSALWHPVLLASAGHMPGWKRIEDPPQELKDRLIVVPSVCVQKLPTGFAQRAKEEGATLIRKTASRDEIVHAALEPLVDRPAVAEELAADFLALGYCYLQIQLLTRQMRYSSNLDEVFFASTLLAAARGAVTGDEVLCREKLSACFSLLAEERDHYYPVDAFLVDLTMVASTTLGPALAEDLARRVPTSVIASADLVAEMASKHPATLEFLKAGLARGDVGLIGGEATETRLPLLAHETILAEVRRGLALYEQHLGVRPEVFGRWRYGLTPHLPGILHRLGFSGALHTGFDEGKTPDGLQLKIGWEGLDGSAIDSIARTPLDASKPQTFLALASKMGESMDSDHVATLCLAHWPGQASPWLDDLRRIGKYCAALGKFVTAPQYFRETASPGHLDRFEADRYRSPYLKQAIIRKQPDPLTSSVKYWQAETSRQIAEAAGTLATLVTGQVPAERESLASAGTESAALDDQLGVQSAAAEAAGKRLAHAIAPGKPGDAAGTLVINPLSFVRRIGVELSGLAGLPTVERPVYAADQEGGTSQIVVDVPGMGFVHIAPGKPAASDRKSILLVEENTLRNEFFEAIISPTTGTLASLHEYKSRGNRLSQQLALRMPGPRQKPGDTYRDPDESAVYSVMAADSIETTIATTTLGEIRTRGQLLDAEGRRLAGFVQTYRLWRGSRVLHVEIELDPVDEPKADPWNSYYCARFAWPDEGAELYRTQHQTRTRATEKKIESPHYVEIVDAKASTTILTGGLAFHRRHELRMLDTLLVSRHERARTFRLGIGVDLPHPLHEAIGLLAPPLVVPGISRPTSGSSGWLMHLSSRNVIATHWEPLVREGRMAGFRARLLETAGRPVSIALSAFRAIASGARIDFAGNRLSDLLVEEGKLKLDLAAYEWAEVEAVW